MPVLELASNLVRLIRLAKAVTPDSFRARLASRLGVDDEELLSWVDGNYFYIAEGYEKQLLKLLPQPLDEAYRAIGAVETLLVPLAELLHRLERRRVRPSFLRDRQAEGIAGPVLSGTPVQVAGQTMTLDWQLGIAGIPEAWNLFGVALNDPQAPWKSVRVAHIDTGCTRHPALGFVPGGSATSRFLRPDLGRNLFAEIRVRNDDFLPGEELWDGEEDGPFDNLIGGNAGHGTKTSSVLAGYLLGEDGSPAFLGAAPEGCVIPYRVTDSVLIDHVPRLLAKAIDDALEQGCRVISMSLGGIAPSRLVGDAIDRAYEKGVLMCVAAGNMIRDVTYPGCYNRVLTVGGISPNGADDFRPWEGASRGKYVDVCGPASSVRRASTDKRSGKMHYSVAGNGSGTSYATALCAGIAALWIAKRERELTQAYGEPSWQWVSAFKQTIRSTAVLPASGQWDHDNWGAGAYRADLLLTAPLPPAASLHHEKRAAGVFDPQV